MSDYVSYIVGVFDTVVVRVPRDAWLSRCLWRRMIPTEWEGVCLVCSQRPGTRDDLLKGYQREEEALSQNMQENLKEREFRCAGSTRFPVP